MHYVDRKAYDWVRVEPIEMVEVMLEIVLTTLTRKKVHHKLDTETNDTGYVGKGMASRLSWAKRLGAGERLGRRQAWLG